MSLQKNTSSSPGLVHVDTSNNYREEEAKSKILGSVESRKWCAAKAPGPGKARLAESLMIGWSGILVRFHGRLESHAGVCWSKTAWHGMAWVLVLAMKYGLAELG